jgi:hypothetical protein
MGQFCAKDTTVEELDCKRDTLDARVEIKVEYSDEDKEIEKFIPMKELKSKLANPLEKKKIELKYPDKLFKSYSYK